VALLEPALTGQSGRQYAQFIGDLDQQKAHAETVLVPIRTELAAIADDLEQAVAAMTVRREGDKVWVECLPPAPGPGNGYLRGLESILAQQGTPVSYDRLMALSGLAFITQADSAHRWEGKVDVGWWPLDVWGLMLRLEFVGRAIGHELNPAGAIGFTAEQFLQIRDELPAWYRRQIEPQVKRSIDAGCPVLAFTDFGYVITGYDDAAAQPPVFGRCGCDTKPGQGRCGEWPSGVLVLGKRTPPIDARAADIAALRYAVALAHDQAGPFEPEWRSRRFTGQKAYAAWAALLRNPAEPVEDRHHANMQFRLMDNRQSAVRYLNNLAVREHGEAADALRQAADAYAKVLELLSQVEPAGLAGSHDQRRGLAELVDRVAVEELQAAAHLQRVTVAMAVRHESPVYTTDRLVIRRFSTDDWQDMQAIARDMEASGAAIYDHPWPTSEDGARGMAEYVANRPAFRAVCLKDTGRVIGLLAFNDIDASGRLDLGHVFHAGYRRDGLDTEAIRCLLPEAFAMPQVESVIGRNAVEWKGQLAPLIALGFRELGRGTASFARDAQANPIEFVSCEMELTRQQWLENAKAAQGGDVVKRENGRTWMDVPGFDPGLYASSVHGAQARILQTLGEALTYEDLICYSGFAFRIGVHEGLCPSAGHPCCGYMCLDGSHRALPWETRMYDSAPWGNEKADRAAFEAEARAAVKASIDRGVPVHYGSEEDGLIVGYGDDGQRWLCTHPYHEGGRKPFWHDEVQGFAGGKWPWGIVVWIGPKPADQRPTDRELTIGALRQAVAMWTTEKSGAYNCGEAAYAHWLNWLHGVEAGTVQDPGAGMQGNGWCYDVLVHSRRIAGPWLKAKADLFPGEARAQLLRAADHYTQIPTVCMEGLTCPWDLTLGPGKLDQWTSDLRQSQIRRLGAAREHDRAAFTAIGQALAVIAATPE
jgi:RimJ/RimL family protein N-acetyltransferase